MSRELRLDTNGPLLRAAILSHGRLTDLQIDRADRPSLLGAVILGRVARIVPGLEAAFVEIGDSQQALLNLADVRPRRREARIGQVLRAGQAVPVQVKAEAHRDKGATVTMDITLPGRFLVHAPLGEGVHLSKRLGKGPERARLLTALRDMLPRQGGWIVRGGAAEVPLQALEAEAEALWVDWRDVLAQGGAGTPPLPLRPGPEAWERTLIEHGGQLTRIRVEGAALYRSVMDWCAARAPDLAGRVALHAGPLPLSEEDDVEGVIAALAVPRVPLSGGGSLVIEPTEALTAIDVNGGERGNALGTNLEACDEIARQLRLRNVGGIVVVDFINMGTAADRERIVLALGAAVSDDPAGTHVYGMSRLGLVELTRTRRGPPLASLLGRDT